ncbi:acetyltransferase [Spongiimicrobium sp. 2-473A-2-J]|uniref:acetyltransferase n=1 Tax=Eudoraea algarum TaxID=3417568 RepID=UPI003D35A607
MQNIVIFGASGHGSVVLDCLEREGKYNVVGFVDSFKKEGRKQNGYEILGREYDLPFLMERHNLYGGIIAVGDNWTRNLLVKKILSIAPSFNFISAVHPSAVIGKNVDIGMGTAVMPGAIINANSIVGDFCIINTNSSLGHDGTMENYSSIASGVCTGGGFTLGEFSAISVGARIIENITIMDHTLVGAGALVVKDIESHVVAYGSPARIIRKRSVGEHYLSGNKSEQTRTEFPLIPNNF